MTSLASITQPISQSIIQNLHQLIRIGSAVRHLILKSLPVLKFSESFTTLCFRNCVQYDQSLLIDDQRLKKIINCTNDCYFQVGKAEKQKYEWYMKSLLQKIEKIRGERENEFYQERRKQISLIAQVISAIDRIQSNLKHCFSISGNKFPGQIQDKINETISLTYKIKLISKNNKVEDRSDKHTIIFNFHTPHENQIRIQSYSDQNFQKSESQKKSTAVTNNTTRPTSTTKSTRDHRNLKKITDRFYRDENPQTPHEDNENRIQYLSIKKKKQIQEPKQKIERCQTAKKIKEKSAKEFVNKKRNAGSSMAPLRPIETKEPDPQNTQIIENKRQVNQNSPIAVERQVSVNISLSRLKNYQQSHKSHKKFKLAKDQNAASKQRFEEILQSSKGQNRRKKGSQNIALRNQLKLLQGRNYNSHQNFTSEVEKKQTKIIKKIRNNQYQKKKKSSRRFSKQKEEVLEEFDTFYLKEAHQKKCNVLLIKPHPENLTQTRKHELQAKQMKRQQKRQQQRIKRLETELSSSEEAWKKQNQVCLFQQKSKHQLLNKQEEGQTFKVSLEQINKIRQQFTKPKWELKPIFADNAENSVFFIEQGFLSHRENVRFQSYLKRMKETGGGFSIKEPFNLDFSSLQLKNQKLIGFERKYTFLTEDEWIKQKFKTSPDTAEINQIGLDLNLGQLL